MSEPRGFNYDPTIFDVGSMEQARWVALNPDGVRPPEELWGIETEYLMEIVDAYLPPRDATALDFGCGPGRLAKPLIERKNGRFLASTSAREWRRWRQSTSNLSDSWSAARGPLISYWVSGCAWISRWPSGCSSIA
jgi:hypothetical protein